MTINPTVLRAGEGRTIWQLGNHFTVKAAGENTLGHFAMLEQICDGAPAPMHVHENEEEAFYVLDGSVDLYLGDEVHHVDAGAFCLVPRGTPHTFTSTSAEPARMLVLVSPSGFEKFFAEVEQHFPESDGMPAPEQVGPTLTAIAAKQPERRCGSTTPTCSTPPPSPMRWSKSWSPSTGSTGCPATCCRVTVRPSKTR